MKKRWLSFVRSTAPGTSRRTSADRAKFAKGELYWVGYVLGKRAARRVIGDHVLTEQDLVNGIAYPDGIVTTDWYIDLHFPHPAVERRFGKDVFRSTAYDFYSKNIENLFLAGKDISATHVAMGSHRVMNTGGAMGTAVARAAAKLTIDDVLPIHLDGLRFVVASAIIASVDSRCSPEQG